MKSFPSRVVRGVRLGIKRTCGKLVAALGPKSYSLFGVPAGLISVEVEETVIPQEQFTLPLPKSIAGPQFVRDNKVDLPPLGFFELKNGMATHLGGNLDSRGRLVRTYLKPVDGKTPENHDLFNFSSKRFFPKVVKEERVLSLTAGWQDMFFHWMYEVLPRLALVQKMEGKIYIDQGQRFQRESLALFGIEKERIIDASQYQGVWAQSLIVPAVPWLPTKWSCNFLRENIGVKPQRTRRLYLSRRDAEKRRVLNEEELLPILEKHGFEVATTSGLPFADQVRLFAEAEIVVGPHGAGFSHLAFCRPHTPVLELFAPPYTHTCYWQVAVASSLPYHYLFGRCEEMAGDPDFSVDPQQFEEALICALADRQH